MGMAHLSLDLRCFKSLEGPSPLLAPPPAAYLLHCETALPGSLSICTSVSRANGGATKTGCTTLQVARCTATIYAHASRAKVTGRWVCAAPTHAGALRRQGHRDVHSHLAPTRLPKERSRPTSSRISQCGRGPRHNTIPCRALAANPFPSRPVHAAPFIVCSLAHPCPTTPCSHALHHLGPLAQSCPGSSRPRRLSRHESSPP